MDRLAVTERGTEVGRARRTEGRLELTFASDAAGRSFLKRQYADYPFHLCRVQYLDPELPDMASLYLQSSAGGILAGDTLSLSITAKAGVKAHVTTQASTIAYRMPEGEARQRVSLRAEAGSLLEYLPDPVILFPQARLRSSLALRVAPGACAILADAFLPHDPAGTDAVFGYYASEMGVRDAHGQLLVLDRFHVTGAEARARVVGVTGAHTMQATVLIVADDPVPLHLVAALREALARRPGAYGAASALPNDCGAWARVLSGDAVALKGAMLELWSAARTAITGRPPTPRRK